MNKNNESFSLVFEKDLENEENENLTIGDIIKKNEEKNKEPKFSKEIDEFIRTNSYLKDTLELIYSPEKFDKNLSIFNKFFTEFRYFLAIYKSEKGKNISEKQFQEMKNKAASMSLKFNNEITKILVIKSMEGINTNFGLEELKLNEDTLYSVSKQLKLKTEIVKIKEIENEINKLNKQLENPSLNENNKTDINNKLEKLLENLQIEKNNFEKRFEGIKNIYKSGMKSVEISKKIIDNKEKFQKIIKKIDVNTLNETVNTLNEFIEKYGTLEDLGDNLRNTLTALEKEKVIQIEAPEFKGLAPSLGI